MAKTRALSISDVRIYIEKSNPPQLAVFAGGMVGTPGWTGLELNPLEKKLSADGILDLEFVGEPPTGPVIQVVTPVSAHAVWTEDVDRLVGVKVYSRTNEVTRLVGQAAPQQPTTPAIGEETMPAGAFTGRLTTDAIGEENPSPTTFAPGAENPFPTTFALGEENPFPKTLLFGEEGPKTIALGEETGPFVQETGPGFEDPGFPDWPWAAGFRNPFGSR